MITRYLFKQILSHILIVMFVVLLLDILLTTLSEWSYSLSGSYQASQAVYFVLATSPTRLYDYFPLIVLIGCLTGLGALANSSELISMRAAGLSIIQISRKVMYPAITIMVVMTFIGETVIPELEQIGQSYRSVKSQDSKKTRYGIWHKDGEEYIFMQAVTPEGDILGLTRLAMDDQGTPIFRETAAQAKYQGDTWTLSEVQRHNFNDYKIESETADEKLWETTVSPSLLKILLVEPDKLSLVKLFSYMSYLTQQNIDARNYKLAFWSKVLKPVMTMALVTVAISFIFGPLRKVATGTRVFIGVLVGLVLKMAESILGPACLVYGFHPLFAAGAPIVLSALLGIYLIRRTG